MATLYLDFENGNDNYAGTSFALLAQGTNGRITTATFSSAGASFPNDGSLIGQYLSIFNGSIYAVYNITAWVSATSLTIAAISGGTSLANQAVDRQFYIGGRWKNITTGATDVRTIPGDTIRIMGSPAPTSLGQTAVWTSQALQATKSITGATNATPISITCTAHGYSTGDTVVVASVGGNNAANGTWEITNTGANTFTLDGSAGNAAYTSGGTVRLRNNTRVKLTTAVTQNIASTGPRAVSWTASAQVSCVRNASVFKEHWYSDWITINAAFGTGLAAYWSTGTLDLSSYQQVSFWIYQAIGTLAAAGSISFKLCSDAAGVNAVNTINIPAIPSLGRWMPVTVDLGANLGSNIQSIAFYVNTDNGSQDFYINNILACKASSEPDSLTLTSLIGKNTTGETFWGIQSINGTRVMLDADTNQTPISSSVRGYYGTSETVTTWKRETIKLGPAASSTTALQSIQESGTDGSPITYSGGWDRTAMSTQNLETWLDGVNGNGRAIECSSNSWIALQRISGSRFDALLSLGSGDFNVHTLGSCNNFTTNAFIMSGSSRLNNIEVDFIAAAPVTGFTKFSSTIVNVNLKINKGILSCAGAGLEMPSGKYLITGIAGQTLIANNGVSAISQSGCQLFMSNVKTESNSSGGIANSTGASIYLNNCAINDSQEVVITAYSEFAVQSQNHDQIANNHKIFMDGGLISSATDQRKTPSGISWKLQPTSSTLRNSLRPVILSLAKVACSANNLVTIKAWMYRDNAGLTMRLVCKGGQIAGVASDVVSALSTTNAWEEETITFTPTETGVVEITAEAWGGSTFSGWVDDMTISQA